MNLWRGKILKSQLKKSAVAALVVAMTVPAGVSNADKQQTTRISGKDRITTSVEISKSAYTTSENAVLAGGFSFAGALSAGRLASALDAPFLLSSQNKPDSQAKNEINRLKAKRVFVVGGDNVISKTGIDKDLQSERIDVARSEGQDKYSTSQKIMEKTKGIISPEYLLIASGKNFPDALAATGFFINHKSVMVLSDGLTCLQSNLREIAVGGINQLPLEGFKGKRVSGKDRCEAALEIAKLLFNKNNNIILASGQIFADSLSAISLTKKHDIPIILAQSNSLTKNARRYLNDRSMFIVDEEKTVINDILTRKKLVVKKEDRNLHTETGQYYSSLVSKKLSKAEADTNNQAYNVRIESDQSVVSGYMLYYKKIDSFFGGDNIGHNVNHSFETTDKTVFRAVNSLAKPSYFNRTKLLNYYGLCKNTDLGLVVTVKNDVAVKVEIAS